MDAKTKIIQIAIEDHGISISRDAINKYLSGEINPRWEKAEVLAKILNTEARIWAAPDNNISRELAVSKFARDYGLDFHKGRGRPRK